MSKQNKIIRTPLALIAKCKCGSVVAASLIYGGVSLDEDFMSTVAETHNNGGEVTVVNTNDTKVTLCGCKCEQEK